MTPPWGNDIMTEGHKDGKTEGRKLSVVDVIDATLESFAEVCPSWGYMAFYDLLKGAVEQLQYYIKTGKVAGVSWKNPFLQLEYELKIDEGPADLTAEEAVARSKDIIKEIPDHIFPRFMSGLTNGVVRDEAGQRIILTDELDKEIADLPEDEAEERIAALSAGFELQGLKLAGTMDTPSGKSSFTAALGFAIRPLTVELKRRRGRFFFPIQVGLTFTEGDPAAWSEENQEAIWSFLIKQIDDLVAPYLKDLEDKGEERPAVPKPDYAVAIREGTFAVAGGYVRPIFGLSERKQDFPLLQEYYEPQTPLNWAVGLVMFSLTDEDKVKTGDWQEASVRDIEDRVFCLTERDAPRRGDHRTDILAEVVKLHTTRNWYYEIDTVRVGRAWTKRAVIGSQYAMPELQLVFLDTQTGKRVFPTDATVRALTKPLEVKGRRVAQPDGKGILALPKGRWELEAIRWRWVQAFNDDLLITPALEEKGKRIGLPKKTTTGKTIRKGYLVKVAGNVLTALHNLRAEGRGALYASRLLLMLAHNLNKTESGIKADRVFRMLGIPEDYANTAHEKPEDLVARAVLRLKERDIRALLAGSDEYPRTDPNQDRRKGPYYRLIRSPEYTPRTGITSKEDALAIEAEYQDVPEPKAIAGPKADQAVLPGMEEPNAQPIPAGKDIRAAREAAGVNLRNFARMIKGPAFKTWSNYETGKPIRVGSIKPDAWQRVRDFIAQHGGKGSE